VDLLEHLGDLVGRRRGQRLKHRRGRAWRPGEDAIEHEGVKVYVGIQGAPEALNDSDGPAAWSKG
jgi:hypothetical protein